MRKVELPEFKDYTGQPIRYIQPKLDGHLAKIYKGKPTGKIIDGNTLGIKVLTKNDKNITEKLLSISHIRRKLDILPANSVIFAEMHCPGIHATSVPTMLNDADEKLMLTVFAVPLLNSKDLTKGNLIDVLDAVRRFGFTIAHPTEVPKGFVDEEGQQYLLELAEENRWEGWVLKEGHMTGWYKLKPVKTVDAFVIDTYASDSKRYKGGLKGIRFAVWDKEGKIRDLGTAGNGFKLPYRLRFVSKEKMDILLGINWPETDEKNFQEHLTVACLAGLTNRDTLLNQVCEIAYDSVAAGGKLRFPRFIRWRNDKDIKDCTEEQLK